MPAPGESTCAEELADHRLAYLDLEGDVSGGRGAVTRVGAGDYELVDEADDLLRMRLVSPELSGLLSLVREGGDAHRWRVSLAAGDSPSA